MELQGLLVPNVIAAFHRAQIAKVFNIPDSKFFGAQPVSFNRSHVNVLKEASYLVSEKTDGTRCLLYTSTRHDNPNVVETFLIDRNNNFYWFEHVWLPTAASPKRALHTTLLDGELVMDNDNGSMKLRYYAFDILILLGVSQVHRPLHKRLGTLEQDILKPYYAKIMTEPNYVMLHPFKLHRKQYETAYNVCNLFQRMKRLLHRSDGIIFTSLDAPYLHGTNNFMLKWKASDENSVDFRLKIVNGINTLWIGMSDKKEAQVDTLTLSADPLLNAWLGAEQDGNIIECNYDLAKKTWAYMKNRPDKLVPNHSSTYKSVMKSIADNLSKEELLRGMNEIREAWKAREEAMKIASVVTDVKDEIDKTTTYEFE